MAGGWPLGLEICNGADQGSDTANSRGTAVTASNGAYGSYTQLVASTPVDASFVVVQIITNASVNAGFGGACKIAVGGAGSEVDIIKGLHCAAPSSGYNNACYEFPVCIPAGTRISAAVSCDGGADTFYVSVLLFDGAFTMIEGCSGVDSIGSVNNDARGTTVTAGAANTKGNYAQLTASSAKDYIGLAWSIATIAAPLVADRGLWDIAIGGAGSEKVIVPNWQSGFSFPSEIRFGRMLPIPIPAATRIAARVQTPTGSQNYALLLYGVYQ